MEDLDEPKDLRDNPVRARLVSAAEDWPFAGEIEAFQI